MNIKLNLGEIIMRQKKQNKKNNFSNGLRVEIFLSQRVDHFDKFFILFTKTAHLINAILIKTQITRRLKKRREKIIQTPDAVCQHALLIVSDDRIRRKCLFLFVTSSLS